MKIEFLSQTAQAPPTFISGVSNFFQLRARFAIPKILQAKIYFVVSFFFFFFKKGFPMDFVVFSEKKRKKSLAHQFQWILYCSPTNKQKKIKDLYL